MAHAPGRRFTPRHFTDGKAFRRGRCGGHRESPRTAHACIAIPLGHLAVRWFSLQVPPHAHTRGYFGRASPAFGRRGGTASLPRHSSPQPTPGWRHRPAGLAGCGLTRLLAVGTPVPGAPERVSARACDSILPLLRRRIRHGSLAPLSPLTRPPTLLLSTSFFTQGKVFVGGLSWQTDDERLRNYFSNFGVVTEVRETEPSRAAARSRASASGPVLEGDATRSTSHSHAHPPPPPSPSRAGLRLLRARHRPPPRLWLRRL